MQKNGMFKGLLFLLCVGIYLGLGLIIKWTSFFDEPIRWYQVLVIAPLGVLGMVMQIYPCLYINSKLQDWGMHKEHADKLAAVFWLSSLVIWYLVFIEREN